MGTFSGFSNFAFVCILTIATAVHSSTQPACFSDLAQTGISSFRQKEFCKSISESQWACSQTIIKKYHSLEFAKEICLAATASESACYINVINRNFDPYVAKKVCALNKKTSLLLKQASAKAATL